MDETLFISHSVDIIGKDMKPNIISLALGKIVTKTIFFYIGMATDLGEGKL